MHVILDIDPPDEYSSTPLAVRPVKVYRVEMTPSQWKKLNRKEQDLVIAQACSADIDEDVDLSQIPVEFHTAPLIQHPRSLAPHDRKGIAVEGHSSTQQIASGASSASSLAVAVRLKGEVTPVLPSLKTYNDLLSRMEDCLAKGGVVEIKRVQVSDCGGQPQFLEILPVFLRGTSLYIFVFKLNQELGARPMIKYHVDGKAICKPYQSSETYKQMLEHCLRVIRSQKATDESKPPKIMIVGTHKDEEHMCTTETRKDKNERLATLLLPEFKKEVVYYRPAPPKELIYALNAKNPGKEEKSTAESIRLKVSSECAAEAVEIPLQWHALEGVLEDLAKALDRDVLSRDECFRAAESLHFEDESALDDALKYLDQLNLIFYYPDILPGVVFASAQVLLDKVTELVVAVHELQDGTSATGKMADEKWQRFCDHALVSVEFLAQKEFQKHYKPGLFIHDDLIVLFKKLLIFAAFNETEVFVPALLRRLKKEEIDVHRVPCNSSAASPLVLTFPKHGGPLLGVFCASVVALLSEDNIHPCPWNLKMEADGITPSCLYRNCVQFTIQSPRFPGYIVVIDSFEYIEVHVHINADTASKLKNFARFCGMIRNSVIQAVRKATVALNYDYHEPCVCFGCPCGHPVFHTATIDADNAQWICSQDCGDVAANQRIWLKEEKDTVPCTPIENKPLPPSVALTLNQQATSSDSTPALKSLDSRPEQGGCVPVNTLDLEDTTTKNVRALPTVAPQHSSSPTISTQNKTIPPPSSVTVALNQQAVSSDSPSVLTTLDSTSEQSPSKSVNLRDSTTPKSSQQRVSESTPKRSCHELSPTMRLVPQEGASASISPTVQVETSPNASVHIDSKPTLRQLGCLRFNNQRINVMEQIAFRWEYVADQLHFENHLIATIRMESPYQINSACRKMFVKWLEGVGRQPITWRTLIDALDDAGLPRVAHELNNIIHGTQGSQVHDSSPTTRRRRGKCAI